MFKWFRTSTITLMVLHVLLVTSGYIVTKIGLAEFPPFVFGFWRFLVGLLVVLVITFALKCWPRVKRADWPRFVILAVMAVPLNQLLYLYGMKYTLPSHASFLYAGTAIFALILSALLKYERLRWFKSAAILLSLTGVIVVATGSDGPLIHSEFFLGDMLVLAGVVVWAAYTVLGKPMVQKYGALPTTMVCLIIGSLLGLPLMAKPALDMDYSQVTWHGWGSVVYTGFMITAAAYIVWYSLLRRVDPSQVAILTTPQPVVATGLSIWLLGESLKLNLVVGGLLVLSGVVTMEAPALYRRTFGREVKSETQG
jgi:drug/metabolite transporter (DMT)-like permease